MEYSALTKILFLAALGFLLALAGTPLLTGFLYRNKLGKQIRNDGSTPIYSALHAGKAGVPTMGGILVWATLGVLISLFWLLDRALKIESAHALNFLTRRETLLPLGALVGASLVGLIDDLLDVKKMGYNGRGLRFRFKIVLYAAVALIGGIWFYYKLGFSTVYLPFYGNLSLGPIFLPFFILTVIATSFAVNETDGLDGLAGGTLLIAFVSFAIVAYTQGRYNLASFIAVICGALLAFLWFNVYPARFFMGDTGSMGLGVLLAVVAFYTNSVYLLLFVGFVFIIEAGSYLLQLFWRKTFKRKLFLSSPLHHHLEALGWPETKVTMRFWIIAAVFSVIGMIVYFRG